MGGLNRRSICLRVAEGNSELDNVCASLLRQESRFDNEDAQASFVVDMPISRVSIFQHIVLVTS